MFGHLTVAYSGACEDADRNTSSKYECLQQLSPLTGRGSTLQILFWSFFGYPSHLKTPHHQHKSSHI